MLVVISDLHLTDGTSGETISADAFRVFYEDIKTLVHEASFQKSPEGRIFKPVDRCDIVMNGDVLDVIRSDLWRHEDRLKPWSNTGSDVFIDIVRKITEQILACNETAMAHLRRLSEGVEIETADGGKVNVPVGLHYMVGNHDWFYHLPDVRLNPCRQQIIETMGLSNPPDTIFPHIVDDLANSLLEQLCLQHRVYIQHGDINDPINFIHQQGRNYSSLGDAIVILLLNRFPEVVKKRLKLADNDALFLKLRELDNVRPLYEAPAWLNGVLIRYTTKQQSDEIIRAWRDCIRDLRGNAFVKKIKRWLSISQRIQFWLQFGLCNYLPFKLFIKIANFAGKLLPANEPAYIKAAENEAWLKQANDTPSKADYVTYGHTHMQLFHPIDETEEQGQVRDKIYMNSGTWRVIHLRTKKNKNQFEYNRHHVMTYLCFYKGNERGGRPYESWSGRLGVD